MDRCAANLKRYRVGADGPTHQGSWWPDYDQWLAARSGSPVPAPKTRDRGAKAPGSYVHAR